MIRLLYRLCFHNNCFLRKCHMLMLHPQPVEFKFTLNTDFIKNRTEWYESKRHYLETNLYKQLHAFNVIQYYKIKYWLVIQIKTLQMQMSIYSYFVQVLKNWSSSVVYLKRYISSQGWAAGDIVCDVTPGKIGFVYVARASHRQVILTVRLTCGFLPQS